LFVLGSKRSFMRNLDPFRFARLLLAYHRKELLRHDEEAVREVLASSSELKALDEELKDKDKISRELALMSSFDTEVALRRVRPEAGQRRSLKLPFYYKAAAVVLLLLGVSALYFLNPKSERQLFYSEKQEGDASKVTLRLSNGQLIGLDTLSALEAEKQIVLRNTNGVLNVSDKLASLADAETPVMNRLEVPFKTTYKIVLQDGTRVWLNSGSVLEFPSAFSKKERRVKLIGEAYFEVAHDDKLKFLVEANGVSVQVLGTTFNVKAYDDEPFVSTTLVEGKVSVTDHSGRILKMIPGEQAAYNRDKNEMIMRIVDPHLYTAWKDGAFDFENAPLNDILRRIGRWYGLDIYYEQSSLKSTVYSGKMEMYDSVEDILRKFEKSGDLHFRLEGNSIKVSK